MQVMQLTIQIIYSLLKLGNILVTPKGAPMHTTFDPAPRGGTHYTKSTHTRTVASIPIYTNTSKLQHRGKPIHMMSWTRIWCDTQTQGIPVLYSCRVSSMQPIFQTHSDSLQSYLCTRTLLAMSLRGIHDVWFY